MGGPILTIDVKKIVYEFLNVEFRILRIALSVETFLNTPISDLPNKEQAYSIQSFYFFLKEDFLVKFFEKIYNSVKIMLAEDGDRVFRNNDIFLIILKHFYGTVENIACFYAVVTLKSFVDSSYAYDSLREGFISSDIILTKACNIFKNFSIFYELFDVYQLDFESTQARSHFLALFEFLSIKRVFETKYVWVKKEGRLCSEKYWKTFDVSVHSNYEENYNVFLEKPDIRRAFNNKFICGGYYNKVFEIFRKNYDSGHRFEIYDDDYIKKLAELEWYVDYPWFSKIMLICKERYDDFNNLELIIQNLIEKIDSENWRSKSDVSLLSDKLRMLTIFKFHSFIKNISKIWFPFYFDFRGRLYFNSVIGVTSNKILRTVYYYGIYESPRFNQLPEYSDELAALLKKYEEVVEKVVEMYNVDSYYKKTNILFLLISIGKFFVKKNKSRIHMDDFVKLGYGYLKNGSDEFLKLEDLIELRSYKDILETNRQMKKRIVIKDFTASFFQHLTRLLGPKDLESVKLANMYNDLSWYDPYSKIIEDFLEANDNLVFKRFYTRKLLKKVIMTIPYSIGKESAWGYFIESLDLVEIENIKGLKREFFLFFSFVKKKLESDFYFKNPNVRMVTFSIINASFLKKIEIKMDKAKAQLIYYEEKLKVIDLVIKINNKSHRITKKIHNYDKEKIDYNNIVRSIRANWIALMDADLLRKINWSSGRAHFSIHDSILIDWNSIETLIITTNLLMNDNDFNSINWDNKHDFKIFSFFILI